MANYKNEDIYECIVIGAGAAGLFYVASDKPKSERAKTVILEKTNRPGQKLLMSGNGMCNITHGGSIKDFISKYGEHGTAIRRCLFKNNNIALAKMIESLGVPVSEREDGKIFPTSLKAADVRDALLNAARNNGWKIRCNAEVSKLELPELNRLIKVTLTDGTVLKTRKLVIATGGASYPSTGSDGSFFSILSRDLGMKIIKPRPALAPVYVQDYNFGHLSGISLEEVEVHCTNTSVKSEIRNTNTSNNNLTKKKLTHRSHGPMLFTHRGFSGPAMLHISQYVHPGSILRINYLPSMNHEQVYDILRQDHQGNNKKIVNYLSARFNLPKAFVTALLSELLDSNNNQRTKNTNKKAPSSVAINSSVAADNSKSKMNQLSNKDLRAIAELITNHSFSVSGTGGWNDAMVTAGGVSLDQIDVKTMSVRLSSVNDPDLKNPTAKYPDNSLNQQTDYPGISYDAQKDYPDTAYDAQMDYPGISYDIRVIGEALDVNGDTGGYNLQFAYSSAMAALTEL